MPILIFTGNLDSLIKDIQMFPLAEIFKSLLQKIAVFVKLDTMENKSNLWKTWKSEFYISQTNRKLNIE